MTREESEDHAVDGALAHDSRSDARRPHRLMECLMIVSIAKPVDDRQSRLIVRYLRNLSPSGCCGLTTHGSPWSW